MFEIARMDFTQYRKHFFPKQQDGWDILSCCFAVSEALFPKTAGRVGHPLLLLCKPAAAAALSGGTLSFCPASRSFPF